MTAGLPPHDRSTGRTALLWTTAAAVAVAGHAGAILWVLRQPPSMPAAQAAAPAVMIDLLPTPAAPVSEEEEIEPDLQHAPMVDTTQLQADPPIEDAAPPPLPEDLPPPPDLPPPDEITEPVTDALPPIDMPPVLAEVVEPRPVQRPKPELQRRDAPKVAEKPSPARKRDEQKQAKVPTAQVAEKPAATQNNRGSVGGTSRDWKVKLMAHLERRKRYPATAQRRREEGVVSVTFEIDGSGRVLSVALAQSSGYPDLDAEVLALLKRASPVPAPPEGVKRVITAPVNFNLR